MTLVRLQKILAQAGIASRRASEAIITEGRVRVNGKIVRELGSKADPHKDKIEVDGRRLVRETPVYFVLHKPREVVATLSDPEERASLEDYVRGIDERVFPVGRLDYHTSGVILLTNDGELSEALLRPRTRVPKIYRVKVNGHPAIEVLERLRNGVELDDGYQTKPTKVFVERQEANYTLLQMTLTEGKNRQIHRMVEAVGHRVMRLARISFAGIDHENLRPGQRRPLKKKEVERLKRDYVLPYRRWRKNQKTEED